MSGYLLGIDYGTGGCKVTAIDETGAFVGEASTEYATYHDHPGWSEQEPNDWWAALGASLAKLAAKGVKLSQIAALSLDGSTHNAVLLDADFKPLRRTIMWTDQRATAECEALKTQWGENIFSTCFQMPAPTWTLPQMMWLKAHEPEVLEKTEHVLFVKDYVRYLLTGHAATDFIEAQGTLMYRMPGGGESSRRDAEAQRESSGSLRLCGSVGEWSSELVELAGLKFSALPEIVRPTDVVGKVTAKAAAETGLHEGCAVVCGTSDMVVEDYGAGAVESGDLVIKLATAGNVNAVTAVPRPTAGTLTYSHVVPGLWYAVSATNAAALCMRWLRDTFYGEWLNAASPLNLKAEGRFNDLKPVGQFNSPYEVIDAEAASSPVGANGVVFHPYLQGERCPYWDANLRASFTGVSISSSRGDFARALMEGVAFSLRDCYGLLEKLQLPVKRIFLIGGGARSRLWSEIVANVFNCEVAVPTPGDASFGACLLAGTGIGVFADVKAAVAKCLHVERTITPAPEAAEKYDRLYREYKAMHDVLAPIYGKIAQRRRDAERVHGEKLCGSASLCDAN